MKATAIMTVALALARVASGQTGGYVSGVVRAEGGAPVAGATVTLNVRPTGLETRIHDVRTVTNAAGSYSFRGVPAGRYLVCAQLPGSDFVSPCFWNNAPPILTDVTDGGTARADVTLATGYRLKIRLDDGGGALVAAGEDQNSLSILVAIVSGSAGFVPVLPSKQDITGRDYEVVVPFGMPFKLTTSSEAFDLNDDRNARIANNNFSREINIPKGGTHPVVRLGIAGRQVRP